MSLCSLCKDIPWDNLPTVPSTATLDYSGYTYLHEFGPWPEDQRGYPHHQSLEALGSSATDRNCGICRLILKQVEICQSELEELKAKWDTDDEPPYAWPLWKLWIVKRRNGGDGVWVMSSTNGENKELLRFVAAIGLCVEDGNPLARVLRGRPVEDNSGTLKAISTVQNWVTGCTDHHNCIAEETFLPSRVVDVGDNVDSPYVKIRETDGNECGKYISLSYCWGVEPQFMTTKSTLEELKRQITISNLSQTHQDVIKLARGLGVRYVWIDGLCICQGDYEDWARESAKMLSIYGNAWLTVAASKAKCHTEGLFNGTMPRDYFEFEYAVGDLGGQALAFNLPLLEEAASETYISLQDDPLSARSWALQERVLSRRTLLYAKQQMFFECKEGFRGEDGLLLDARFDNVHDMPGEEKNLQKSDALSSDDKEALLQHWCSLLWVYGPRKLTKASDKLPAISGLARIFAKRLDDEYVAAKVLDAKVDLKGSNLYGEVTSAWITIQAPMERLYLDIEDWDPAKTPYDTSPPVRTARDETISRFDFDFSAEDAAEEALKIVKSLEGKEFFALVLLKRKDDEDTYDAIMVKKVNGGEEYERVGYCYFGEAALGRRPEEETQDGFPTITLV
ncbi:hypothetical protein F53441_11636 [Fusarium austroafricanum]|uniref:Heterokaryon incompatibility domain-containing protein n=1 Tax=Fusarium austroafricanum TaxID=2364996 RepID=A0A8H4K4V2_9HYPO|nr:hypothetical protein F53441_11636 [Fusarium austroafricanum]